MARSLAAAAAAKQRYQRRNVLGGRIKGESILVMPLLNSSVVAKAREAFAAQTMQR